MRLGELFFKIRGYTPVPFLAVALIFAEPRKDLVIFGALLIAFGEFLRFSGVSYAGGATRTRNVGAPELVTNGPFAYIRNPLYLGNIFMYTGASILTGALLPYLMYIVIFFFGIQYKLIVKYEEATLLELFGEKYARYRSKVPGFFPRISAYPERTKIKANIPGAIKSEKSTFIGIIGFSILFMLRMYLFI